MLIEYKCEECGVSVRKHFNRKLPGRFCSRKCKSLFQKRAKPVSREWLVEHYIEKGMDTSQIGKIVHRDPKSVWNWLKDFDIPTRKRGTTGNGWSPEKGTPNPFKGRKHTEEFKARMSAYAKATGRVPYDPRVGSYMKGRKGAATPNWKGGITPERQAFYQTKEWKKASKIVWKRDAATCQNCGKCRNENRKLPFDIHHIVSFANKELRAKPSNLVLLCEPCHYWVHGKENTEGKFVCQQ